MAHDPEGDAQRKRCEELLEAARARPHPLRLWWRDDDAETSTPALDRLLELAQRHDLPLALAVVPERATADLAERLRGEPKVRVFQHGWSHSNYAPDGEKKVELGGHRPLADVLGELLQGFERLSALLPAQFLPVLVPPWNRVSDSVRDALKDIGMVGLSTFGPAPSDNPHWINAHLDIFQWRPSRRPLSRAEAYARLASELERRLTGDPEPVGILTHHLVHKEASRDLLDDFFALTARHPAIRWPTAGELFALPSDR